MKNLNKTKIPIFSSHSVFFVSKGNLFDVNWYSRFKSTYLQCLIYADDIAVLTESASGLQKKLKKLKAYSADWCLNVKGERHLQYIVL